MIRSIGDSHANYHAENRDVIVHHLGAGTAYQLIEGMNSSTECGFKVREIIERFSDAECFLISFGEVDCRIHIGLKASQDHLTIAECIANTAHRFIDFIETLPHCVPILIQGIPPVSRRLVAEKSPAFGTVQERKTIVQTFDSVMRCTSRYVSILDSFADADGYMREELAFDDVHLKHCVSGEIIDLVRSRL